MGEKGGCGGCWCMFYRTATTEFKENKYEGNRLAIRKLVDKRKPVGLIALVDHEPIGWVALAPRADLPKIENSRILKTIEKKQVWSISCLFVRSDCRQQGVSKDLIRAATKFAREKGIRTLEAYPTIPYAKKIPPAFLWTGSLSSFEQNEFKVVLRSGKTKVVVQLDLLR